jgi:hypothetical protein
MTEFGQLRPIAVLLVVAMTLAVANALQAPPGDAPPQSPASVSSS